jgi:transposase
MEQRRMQAVDLFEQDAGLSKAEIGRRLGVSHQTVSDWHQLWSQGGRDALRAAGRAGRKPRLSAEQLEQVERALENGPTANGYATDLWTLVRVGEVIERVTGVAYHPGHVWRILREQLGWTRQRPARRAVERDDEAINEWVKTRWPKIKRARRRGALICFEDESGFSMLPSVRATWAPRGRTPVLRHRFNWKRLSMAGALVYEPDGSDAHLVFQMRLGAYNDESLIEFLTELRSLEGDRPVVVIWDGLPWHRSRRMTDWVATQTDWLEVERLPGYAHDLNPIEHVWGSLKSKELANLCPDTIAAAADIADQGLNRIGSDRDLCHAFLRHTGLKL